MVWCQSEDDSAQTKLILYCRTAMLSNSSSSWRVGQNISRIVEHHIIALSINVLELTYTSSSLVVAWMIKDKRLDVND